MAVTVLGPPATITGVTATLIAGGTLLANTTYYVRITTRTLNSYYWYNGNRTSVPSVQISFTTDAVNRSARIDWTPITGVAGYIIYCSEISNNYYSKKCGAAASLTVAGTSVSTYTITAPATATSMDSFSAFPVTTNLPYGFSKDLGSITVSFDGTTTLQNIYDAIVASGHGSYVYWDGTAFWLKGGLYCTGTTAGSLTFVGKVICCFQGGIRVTNPNLAISMGTKVAGGQTQNGCIIYSSLESPLFLAYLRLYDCRVTSILIPATYYGWGGQGDIYPSTLTGTDIINLYVDLMGFRGSGAATEIPHNINTNVSGYAAWTGVSTNVRLVGNTPGLYIFTTTGEPAFRDWFWDVQSNSHLLLGIVNPGKKIRIYDCTFKQGGAVTTNNLPVCYWLAGYGNIFADGEYPVEVYSSVTLKIVDSANLPISGASVVLKNKNNLTVLNTTTNAQGLITKADILRAKMDYDGTTPSTFGTTIENLNDFTLTISKTGYETYTQIFSLTTKIDWQVSLKPIVKNRYTESGKPLIALTPEAGSSSAMLEL